MRAVFREYSDSLQDGTYIFVAKAGLFDASSEKLSNDFKKVLSRAKSFT
jgi:ribonuclease P protein component